MNPALLQHEVNILLTLDVGDPEGFHAKEDKLYVKVLQAISDGARNPRKLAAILLQTRAEEHTRWYA
jgi:hypothetical protein